jgi:hypothetical protein
MIRLREKILSSSLTLCTFVVLLFAFNLFFLGPYLTQAVNGGVANITYIGIRLLGFVGLAYSLGKFARRNRFQTISTVMGVAFIDQVLFKWLLLHNDMKANPQQWDGVTDGALLYGVSTGFLFFAPFVILLGFLGYELIRFRKDWAK